MQPDNERRDLEYWFERANAVVILYWNKACEASDSTIRANYLELYLRYRSDAQV